MTRHDSRKPSFLPQPRMWFWFWTAYWQQRFEIWRSRV